MEKKRLGIYIHIPFCIKKCNYCDFCSFPDTKGSLMDGYVSALCEKIRNFAPLARNYSVDTVYFGGGTPTLLPTRHFERLMSALRSNYRIEESAEISCECNPASIDGTGLSALCALGINRLSIGLQSANENELRALGRIHSFEDFKRTFFEARNAGFDNISADLMYGIPHQTLDSFSHSLDELISLSPEHISSYGLKIEEGTVFAKEADHLPLPDEDTELAMYTLLYDKLSKAGYFRYEISNFAKEGFESRHNMRYWKGEEYIGFGVAAHSYFSGERFGNSRDITAFIDGKDIICEKSKIDGEELLEEYIMLRLRLAEGLSRKDFFLRFGKELDRALPRLSDFIKGGFIRDSGDSLAFTTKGFFVSNYILSELI